MIKKRKILFFLFGALVLISVAIVGLWSVRSLSRPISEQALRVEMMKELTQYQQRDNVEEPEILRVEDIPIRNGELLVNYWVGQEMTKVWVIAEQHIVRHLKIPISRNELGNLVDRLREPFDQHGLKPSDKTSKEPAQRLYEILLRDALKDRSGKDIIIVPDGVLRYLPFEFLLAGDDYVGDRWNISYYQSVKALALNRRSPRVVKHQKSILIIADPVYSQEDLRAAQNIQYPRILECRVGAPSTLPFHRLPGTADEAITVAKFFRSPHVLLGTNASEGQLKAMNLGDYRILHFATHAVSAGDVPYLREGAIVLSLVGNDKEDGLFTANEIARLKLSIDLVVLSNQAGLGLCNAFMGAGARSVVLSLWGVADDAASRLMGFFYRYLTDGNNLAESLKLAKRDLRQEEKYAHPFYWAGFILVGERDLSLPLSLPR